MWAIVLLAACAAPLPESQKPAALLAMETARREIETCDLKWTFTPLSGSLQGHAHRRQLRSARDDIVYAKLRNDDGVVGYDDDGSPSRASERRLLRTDGAVARYDEGRPTCNRFAGGTDEAQVLGFQAPEDIRSLGLNPNFQRVSDLPSAIWEYPAPGYARTYREEVIGGVHKVTAELEVGEHITWYVNPAKGWNAERIEYGAGGEVNRVATIELKQFDGVWFPARYEVSIGGADQPMYRIEIEKAEFNRPEHPREFTLADIGVEPGMQVIEKCADGSMRQLVWNGKAAVMMDEFRRQRAEGLVDYGPTLQKLRTEGFLAHPEQRLRLNKAVSTSAAKARVGLWEAYVRDFIQRYSLDDGQTQQCLEILAQCQAQAHAHLDRHRADFERIERTAGELADGELAQRGQRVAALQAEFDKLVAPLGEIFESQLKPRLEKVPTRAQRRAAETRGAASQPRPASAPVPAP